jgi:hypothetical protein
VNDYLYEIIDDYKNAKTPKEKNEIFNSFCSSVWASKNKRRVYQKQIKFKVRSDLLENEIGKVFDTWSEVDYVGYKAMSKDCDWASLIRQKINNLYTRYCDAEVILNKDYMELLKTPKNLYYRWTNGCEMNTDELTAFIEKSIYQAENLKMHYQKQKMQLSWNEYKRIIEGFFEKIFLNCQLIEDYESINLENQYIYELATEDNFYIKYICKCLESYMRNYQKEYYGLKRGRNKKYKRCKECGCLIENTGNRKMFCVECAKKSTKNNWKKATDKYRNKVS